MGTLAYVLTYSQDKCVSLDGASCIPAMGKIHHQLVESLWVLHVQKMIAFFELYLKQNIH